MFQIRMFICLRNNYLFLYTPNEKAIVSIVIQMKDN